MFCKHRIKKLIVQTSILMALIIALPPALVSASSNVSTMEKVPDDEIGNLEAHKDGSLSMTFDDNLHGDGVQLIYQTSGITVDMPDPINPKNTISVTTSFKQELGSTAEKYYYTENGQNKVQTRKTIDADVLKGAFIYQVQKKYNYSEAEAVLCYKTFFATATNDQDSPYFQNNAIYEGHGVMAISYNQGKSWSGTVDPTTGIGESNPDPGFLDNAPKCIRDALKVLSNVDPSAGGVFRLANDDGTLNAKVYNALCCVGWSPGTCRNFKTHFDKLLQRYKGTHTDSNPPPEDVINIIEKALEEAEKEEAERKANQEKLPNPESEKIVEVSTGDAEVYTYNDARNYSDDAGNHTGFSDEGDSDGNGNGTIIPSGEKYVNGLYTESMTGSAAAGMGAATHIWSER